MSKDNKIPEKQLREESGLSTAGVLAFGVMGMIFVSSLLDTMLTIMVKTGQYRSQGTARAYAELGIDYVIQQLNAGTVFGVQNSSGSSATITLPQSILNDPNANVTALLSTLSTTNGTIPASTTNTTGVSCPIGLYDSSFNNNASNNYLYRMVTVTATYGNAVKQIRCLLGPTTQIGVDSLGYLGTSRKSANNTASPNGVFMPYGIYGLNYVVYAGQVGINTYNSPDPRTGADGGSLGKISQIYGGYGFQRSIMQGGSHYEQPDPTSYYGQMFQQGTGSSVFASTFPWMSLTGNVYSNGSNTAYFPVTGPADTQTASNAGASYAHNVFGLQNGIATGVPSTAAGATTGTVTVSNSWSGAGIAWNPGPVGSNGVTYPQSSVTAVPSAPAGSANLGQVKIINGGQLVIGTVAGDGAVVVSGAIGTIDGSGATGPKKVIIAPGSYQLSSLSMTGGSSIQLTAAAQAAISSGTAPPASFYFAGSTTPSGVFLSIDNSSAVNMNSGISAPSLTPAGSSVAGATLNNGFNTQGNLGVNNNSGQTLLQSNQIAITPTPTTNTPSTSVGNVVETSGSAAQIQMFVSYNNLNSSTSPPSYNTGILLSGNERMVLYAPNTGVTLGSPVVDLNYGTSALTNNSNYYGGLVGGAVQVNSSYSSGGGTFVHYDYNLRPANIGGYNNQAAGSSLTTQTANVINPWSPPPTLMLGPTFTGYRALSWQEAVATNVSSPAAAAWAYQY